MKITSILAIVVALSFCAAASAESIDSVGSLVYHLDAGKDVSYDGNNLVSSWASTQNGYNFAATTSSKDPSYVASVAAINGHAAVQFDGANYTQLVTTSSATMQTVILVTKTTSTSGLAGVWGQYDTSYSDVGIRRGDANQWGNGNNNDFAFNGTQLNQDGSVAGIYHGSMTINGVSTHTQNVGEWGIMVATADSAQTWAGTAIGDYFVLGGIDPRPWSGQIAELAAFSGTLTTAQTNAIVSELGTKYGITVSNVPEPTSMVIILSGILAFAAYAWRKRQ